MDEKFAFINEYRSGYWSMKDLCGAFGISRTLGYKYLHRFEDYGFKGLFEISRVPNSSPNKTPEAIIAAITALRKEHPRYGAEKLRTLLLDRFPERQWPAISTINLILKRNGLVKSKRRIRRITPLNPVFDPKAPNDTWSADFKGKIRLRDGNYLYPLTIADSFSRYLFAAQGLTHPTLAATQAVFSRVFKEFGLPLQIHTDNGSPFAGPTSLARLSGLAVWFMELDIDPVYSDPGHPEQNGRHERMHRELKAEVARPAASSLIWQQRRLNRFVQDYNFVRPHKALGNRTPASVYTPSPRPFPARISPWDYPRDFKVMRVFKNGAIRWNSDSWVMVATPLIGKDIGLFELGNGIWRVYFRRRLLGHLDEQTLRINDLNTHSLHHKKCQRCP